MKKRVLVVDLDGTLFKINTFHYFIKFLILYSITHFKIVLFFRLGIALFSRVFSSHAKMKYNILLLLKNRTDIDYLEFANSIAPEKRDISMLSDSSYDIKILATAAPSCYATIIAKNEGFDLCLGTDFPVSEFNEGFENVKDVKRENVIAFLKNQGIDEVDTFITDHIDDFPLIKLAKRNIVVNPNENMLTQLKQNSISFEVLK